MRKTVDELRQDAISIWEAGVAAVNSELLVRNAVRVDQGQLHIAQATFDLNKINRILVVGAGKAGTGMAAGLLKALGHELVQEKKISGIVNVPDDCAADLKSIQIITARPVGVNLPTDRVVAGTEKILSQLTSLTKDDLCICLISGGGSALLSLPQDPITLDQKIELINFLSGRGANIEHLNTVRKQISRVKGGLLAKSCPAPMVTLIISDVLGDPLDLIASGPTVQDSSTRGAALEVLHSFDPAREHIAASIYEYLESKLEGEYGETALDHVQNFVIGNLRVAIEAAVSKAKSLGYRTDSSVPIQLEGEAEPVGRAMANQIEKLPDSPFDCWITGGEPVVHLANENERGLGGRNQQLVLAAADEILAHGNILNPDSDLQFCLLSGGTDGEDGPTDAAGAWIDNGLLVKARLLNLDSQDYLSRNDAYRFFEKLDSLLKPGATHTNVCDLRLVLVCKQND